MANLSDMEELLHKIENEQIRDYMREALTCYMTKAYRGCIVLSFIALFDDITSKLEILGTVNKTAKTISDQVKKRKNEQEVYENYLIEQLKSKQLLQEIDSEFADILRKLRNKSAHPSGHKPSAEEARYVFFEVIDRFLSKPIFATTHLVDEIVKRLSNSNFFVDTRANQLSEVVKEESSSLHIEAIPLLINKLLNSLISEDKTISNNADLFISGLAYKAGKETAALLMKHIIKPKSDDPKFSNVILEVLSLQPAIYKELTETHRNRIKTILYKKINNDNLSLNQTKLRHPTTVLKYLTSVYGDNEFLNEFSKVLKILFKKAPTIEILTTLFKNKPLVFQEYITTIINQAGDNSYDIANNINEKITLIEDLYKKSISNQQSFELITAIIISAKSGASEAKELLKSEFSTINFTKEKSKAYILENKINASEYFKSVTDDEIPEFLL
ncbi:hypothetical protein ASC84_12185 [Acinetobacter sp. Root1280]|uniref:hypothetical protein n=1 Tax=Acinetobacter sp. Root1280 TaxID=1736444 RepID=UPI0006F52AB1|nr:hypothetical protein [Acinetobacter sp. Root1280]KQW88133.1 hypothetical protein ASC84_12185 [Acinetobacter sp. Root1280]